MIFIVVKFTVRPEYSATWLDRVSAFTEGTAPSRGTSGSNGRGVRTTLKSSYCSRHSETAKPAPNTSRLSISRPPSNSSRPCWPRSPTSSTWRSPVPSGPNSPRCRCRTDEPRATSHEPRATSHRSHEPRATSHEPSHEHEPALTSLPLWSHPDCGMPEGRHRAWPGSRRTMPSRVGLEFSCAFS